MGKTLIIAEKPSVMTDLSRALAKVLGKFEKKGSGRDAYFENDDAVITSAVGHLVELRMPMGPNGKKLPWKFDVLPAIPDRFELDPIATSEARLKQVLKLAKRKDVDLIVNACDAGREGELIFRYIIEIGNIQKPVKRLWMQSMTNNAILEAWDKLRTDEQMKPLADAAKCRSESDWLVGLNATRALTCFNSRHGGFNITAAGRVQTPTLAILAAREAEIQAFKPTPYFEVHGTFGVSAGQYLGKWIDPAWKKDESNPHSRQERIWDQSTAETIRDRCEGKSGTVSEEKKAQSQIAPQLYDLTTLQREAPFSAKGTLQIAQALYEKHKVITYPRTDSRYLPEDYLPNVRETMQEIGNSDLDVAGFAKAVLAGSGDGKGPKLTQLRRVFDSKKVSDHFAIIPTGKFAKLSDTEQKVFDMIVKRFIAVFYPHAEFEQTTRLTKIDHGSVTDVFKTDGRILTKPGWLEVYGRRPGVAAGKDELVAVDEGEKANVDAIELIHEQTRPPARFTESTLLSAMEGAGKLVDDEALREAMSERGLGTPATRAATIEGLISQKYMARDGRDLHVTPTGMRLISLVHQMNIEGLYSPKLTGDWEYKLRQMEQGLLERPAFMKEIISYTNEIVEKAHHLAEAAKSQKFPDVEVHHPVHGDFVLRQTDATYESRDPDTPFKLKKHIAGRLITEEELKELFLKGTVGPLSGFKSRFNKLFDASLALDEKFKVNFVFDSDEKDSAVELTEDQLLGEATLADGKKVKVYETEKAYHVPELVTKKDANGIRIGKSILQREIPADQALKLLSEGKTDLLKGFVSNRTKRKFDAHLTFDPKDGKIGFDFPPRAAKKAAAKK
ncbi:topoisomerase C-terminal repeat-containing protein [Luteolibacter pohnpeiensis]|uniref:DNA topoisomerase n=1 Tax=Luteolibacter pohnpeiensis TaxID=454153 RepID=A0A934SDV3_9BACT|nr:DNA topoisomerase [Luteolibacter pohnpeiensis]MBK1883413.1 topoisomerase C-terminal repeat-containing protein [Luteolibacter pohnpeiensis]